MREKEIHFKRQRRLEKTVDHHILNMTYPKNASKATHCVLLMTPPYPRRTLPNSALDIPHHDPFPYPFLTALIKLDGFFICEGYLRCRGRHRSVFSIGFDDSFLRIFAFDIPKN